MNRGPAPSAYLRAGVLALALACAPPAVGAAARTGPPDPLGRALGVALDSARVSLAVPLAESLATRLASRGRAAEAAALTDSIAMRLFGLGTADALAGAARLLGRSVARREAALGADDPEVAATLVSQARVLDYLGRWEEALALASRARDIRRARAPDDPAGIADAQRLVGLFHFYLGRYAPAEAELRDVLALRLAAAPRDSAKLADAWNALGELERATDRMDAATESFRAGLALCAPEAGAEDLIPLALVNNLAGVLKDAARLDEAAPLLERALAMRERSPGADPAGLATARLNLAEVYRLQGRYDEAEPLYESALTLARATLDAGNPTLVPFVSQFAALESALGHTARAVALHRDALALTRADLPAGHPLLAQGLGDLAATLRRAGRHAEADSAYREALALRRGVLGPDHPETALLEAGLAATWFERPAPDLAGAAALVAHACAVLDTAAAFPDERAAAMVLAARIDDARGEPARAAAGLARATRLLDDLRTTRGGGDMVRSNDFAGRRAAFDELLALQVRGGDADAAFATHERSRARLLLEQLARQRTDLTRDVPPAVRDSLRTLELAELARLARLQRELEAVLAPSALPADSVARAAAALELARGRSARALAALREALLDRSPSWHRLLAAGSEPLGARQVATRVLVRGEWLLSYHVGERASWLFVIAPGARGARAYALQVEADAARALGIAPGHLTRASLRAALLGEPPARGLLDRLLAPPGEAPDGDAASRDRAAHALFRCLVPPDVWAALRHARVAIVAPDAALHLLPFETLIVAEARGNLPARDWLDEGPALSVVESATSLARIRARVPAAGGCADTRPVLTVCDPAVVGGDLGRWPALPGSLLESEAVIDAFGADRVTRLAGSDATEARVRAALCGRRFVHLATHGFVTEERGEMLAGLVLAAPRDSSGGAADDGYLQSFELYDLPLRAELAVLSACETHRGPLVEGEGVFALSRGFLVAGAARVVATTTPVSDVVAERIVGDLFRDLAARENTHRPLEVAVALRDAKRAAKLRFAAAGPAAWAPFVLTGAP